VTAYLGSKATIAWKIAQTLKRYQRGRRFWEPFCGALNVTTELSLNGPGMASDISVPLISLFRAIQDGWEAPANVSRQDYHDFTRLPDSDPHKGFAEFFVSFGTKWGGGYARSQNDGRYLSIVQSLRRTLITLEVRGVSIECRSFFDTEPHAAEELTIYCDPPYEGTTNPYGTGDFDHETFWAVCRRWAICGVPVFVSEYSAPDFAELLWEVKKNVSVQGGTEVGARIERLYKVGS